MRSKVAVVLLAAGLFFSRSVFGVTNVVENGNFNGIAVNSTGWTESPSLSPGILFPGGYVSMGSPDTNNLFVFQAVTIPPNTIFVQYSFNLRGLSTDPQGAATFQAAILDSTGTTLLTNLGVAGNGGFNYTANNFNLTNFAGRTVQVLFAVQNFGATNSFFDVTAVSMLAWSSNDIPANDYFTNSAHLNSVPAFTVLGTNVLATTELHEPKILGITGGHSLWWNWTAPGNGTVVLNTKGSSFNTLLGVFTGDVVSNLTQVAVDSSGSNSAVKFPVSAGTTYQFDVDGKNGAIGVVQLNLTFTLDTTPPKVTITSPAAGAKVTNSTVTVKGTASDNVAVAFVQYRLENANGTNDYQNAQGTNSWTAMVSGLDPGLNTIRVRAFDTSSNVSATAARSVNFIVVSPLTLISNGVGTISPNLNNQLLDVGAKYKFTAKPGPGQVLSNWVDGNGDVLGTTAALTVTMQSNLVLQANFVPNPFIPVVGLYQGLFFDTNGPEHQSSGFYNLTLANSGAFSAKVIIAGKSYAYSGQFSAGGFASNNIVRSGLSPVSAQLQLDFEGGITGLLSSVDPWLAELTAERVLTNAAAEAGRYTLVIPGANGDTNSVAQPGGDSFGTVVVSATGGIGFSGALADNTAVSRSAHLLMDDEWPFYIPLYSGKGSIFGWLTLSNQADSDITGTVYWFKPAVAAKFYSAGFTNSTQATGSSYHFTNGVPVLSFSNGLVSFVNGNIPNNFTNQVNLGTNNVVSNLTTNNALTLKLTTSTGVFNVTAVDPDTHKTLTGKGVVLQKQNFGDGFSPGTNQVGQVFWGPAGP